MLCTNDFISSGLLLSSFSAALMRILQRKATLFWYGWLEIVGHRLFIGRVLTHQEAKCGLMYTRLMVRAWSTLFQVFCFLFEEVPYLPCR